MTTAQGRREENKRSIRNFSGLRGISIREEEKLGDCVTRMPQPVYISLSLCPWSSPCFTVSLRRTRFYHLPAKSS